MGLSPAPCRGLCREEPRLLCHEVKLPPSGERSSLKSLVVLHVIFYSRDGLGGVHEVVRVRIVFRVTYRASCARGCPTRSYPSLAQLFPSLDADQLASVSVLCSSPSEPIYLPLDLSSVSGQSSL